MSLIYYPDARASAVRGVIAKNCNDIKLDCGTQQICFILKIFQMVNLPQITISVH